MFYINCALTVSEIIFWKNSNFVFNFLIFVEIFENLIFENLIFENLIFKNLIFLKSLKIAEISRICGT